MKSKFFQIFLITLFALQSCKKETEQENLSKTEVQKLKDSVKSIIVEEPEKELQYSIEVEKIDSLEYLHFAVKNNINKKKITKITDFNQAKKLLKGVIEFDENPDYDNHPLVKKIHFRNGKEYGNTNEYDYYSFIAYYPEEDILLCEGGHTTDISFNLKNGKETEETGNPDYINFSPSGKFRLNGHFGGQECSSYFIQKKIGEDYVKIVQLDEEFEKLTKVWLCIVGESFWADDNTLFLTESSEFGKAKKYFKVKIIEK